MGCPQQRCRSVRWRLAPCLALRPGRGGRRETASARRMRCRGTASCRPGQTDLGERGKRPARAGLLVAARQGPMPVDGRGACRRPHSSQSRGELGTWRRRTAGPQQKKPFGRSSVNSLAPLDVKSASERVLGWQTRLHRWAVQDEQARFGDLFNLICDPATLFVAWDRVKRNRGSRTAGVDGITRKHIEQAGVENVLGELRQSLRDRTYAPLPVREHQIPKRGSGKVRKLGIPALRDRIVQMATELVLEPIFEADSAPRGANQSCGMKGPALGRRDGREKLGAVWLLRWGDPDGSSPDNVASVRRQRAGRASKAERHRETEPVVEAPSLEASPETGGCGLLRCLVLRSWWGSARSRVSPSRGRGRMAGCGAVWRCRRGKAGCRPCRAMVGERGKRPGGTRRTLGFGAGAPSAVAAGAWRRDRSTRRRGKPGTWGRVPASARHDWIEGGRW